MTSPSEMAIDHQLAAEDDPQLAASATVWRPGATVMASHADESKVAGQGDADRSMTFSVPDASMPDAEPEPIPESRAASATASASTGWHEIQVMFVDDPRSAVELAAGRVDDKQPSARRVRQGSARFAANRLAWQTRETRNCALPYSITVRSDPSRRFLPRNLSLQTHVRTGVLMEPYRRMTRNLEGLRLTLAREHLDRPAGDDAIPVLL
jgi:hypothetical protein